MKYSVKKGLCCLNIFLSCLALFIAYRYYVLEYTNPFVFLFGDHFVAGAGIAFFFITHIAMKLDNKRQSTKKWFKKIAFLSLAVALIPLVYLVICDIVWDITVASDLIVAYCILLFICGMYFLLAFTKTIDDSEPEDETIPYSD